MLGLARRIFGNAADAEDVAQEAFVRVWTHAPRWQYARHSRHRRFKCFARVNFHRIR
jgi:DNA-directed RNA polymerase specialized sigma24 family protein